MWTLQPVVYQVPVVNLSKYENIRLILPREAGVKQNTGWAYWKHFVSFLEDGERELLFNST